MDLGKRALRHEALRRRALLSAEDHDQAAAALVAALAPPGPGRAAAYASVGSEPRTTELLRALPGVLLPVLLDDGDLDWAVHDGELVRGPHGLLQPPGRRLGRDAVADCALVVVPALAVDRHGTRLGRGGGSYDRALARTAARVVAALHRGELVERLPAEAHDRPVHAAVLPGQGLVRLRPDPLAGPPGGAAAMKR